MKEIVSDKLRTYFSFQSNIDIHLILKTLNNRLEILSEKLRFKFTSMNLFLFDTRKEFESCLFQIVKENIPIWILGMTNKYCSVVLLDEQDQNQVQVSNYNRIIHELLHQSVYRKYENSDRIPIWLNEGIALFFSNQYSDYEKNKITRHLKYSPIPTFEELNKEFANVGGYHLAGAIIEFIIQDYGIQKIFELCDGYSCHCRIDDEKLLYDKWITYLKKQFNSNG